MAKKRVYELARELGFESKDVLERARELGLGVKTASSGLDEEGQALVLASYKDAGAAVGAKAAPEPALEPEPAPKPAPEPEPTPQPEATPELAPEPEPPPEPKAQPEPAVIETEDKLATDERVIAVDAGITVADFATEIGERTGNVVKELMGMGEMVPGGGTIPTHALESLGKIFGYEVLVEEKEKEPEDTGPAPYVVEYDDDPASLQARPPVITVMGHVDHGKTQLLDTIRQTNVIAGEAGGITQHIGAYQVTVNDEKLTFLDTPGHEAFTALRARGANVTDIAIIVVAADDGVMPQTAEAIAHAQAAEVPIIIAINKMDLETADPYAVRAALTQHGIVVEELGGDVVTAEISALTGDGVEELLEMIALVAEVEELKANPNAPAVGTVIESRLEVGRGPVATVTVQRGTLKQGSSVVAGSVPGRVRAMFDDQENQVRTAGPSTPVLVMGWEEIPTAGDMFEVVKNDRTARKLADERTHVLRTGTHVVPTATQRLETLLENLRTADHAELRIIVRADAMGSLEAIRDSVKKIIREDGKVTIIQGAVGGVTTNDVMLAEASDAVIYGFNARPDSAARAAAKEAGIDVRTFSIIYELLDDIEGLLLGELAPEEIEAFLGVADVREVFRAPRLGKVAGCYVTEGEINRNAKARVVRDGVVVYQGRIISLRRFKDDVPTVATGFECGIGLENFRDVKVGDTIESFEVREIARV
ncbi:MAG: translation initiation factor IF-2 [Actinomycetota bacterium]|nr:translation initiation factor IF-2 [Actinomycetota bacterium]